MARAALPFLLLPVSLHAPHAPPPLSGSIGLNTFFFNEGPSEQPLQTEPTGRPVTTGAAAVEHRRDPPGQALPVRAIYFNLGYGLN